MDSIFAGKSETGAGSHSPSFGILYAEDFDDPPDLDPSANAVPDEPEPPPLTQADIERACAAAVGAARLEWQASVEQARLNAVKSLAMTLEKIEETAKQTSLAAAEGTVTVILSMVAGLLPRFSQKHGPAEVRALLARLLPTIRTKTQISVRVHPDLVPTLQREVEELEPDLASLIEIVSAPLERGDVKANWENGSLTRDSRQIAQAIQDALSELGLLQTLEAPTKRKMAYAE